MNNPSERKGFTFYRSFSEAIALLPEAEQLAAYKAITMYALDGTEPAMESLPLMVQMLWKAFLPNLEADRRRYTNGSKGGAPKGNQNARKNNSDTPLPEEQNNQETTDNQPKNNLKTSNVNVNVNVNANENVDVKENVEERVGESSPIAQNAGRFVPPSIEEIDNYIQKQGFADIDAHLFADYYASVGWCVGGQPMHDWRAALRRWHTRNKQSTNNLKQPKYEPKHTPTNPTNAPRLFRNLADDDYLADAHPRIATPAAHNTRDCREATH